MAAKKKDEVLPLGVEEAQPDPSDQEKQERYLMEYRVSGRNPGYVDQSRDQEPDIAADFGVAPHPELFNPAPHVEAIDSGVGRGGSPGIGEKQPESNLLVNPDEDRAKAIRDAHVAAEQARQAVPPLPASVGAAQPVVVVQDLSEENAKAVEANQEAHEKVREADEKLADEKAKAADSKDSGSK